MSTPPFEAFRGYPVKRRAVQIAGRAFQVLGPADSAALVDDPRVSRRFEQDEFLPYWADLWPASLLLADAVAGWTPLPPGGPDPPVVLEIGCGLGLCSLVALSRGHRVIAADYEQDALAFVAESAKLNGLAAPELRLLDWRETIPGLKVDRILASDVLYETRNIRPVAEFAYNHLKPDGVALVSDCHRQTADAFDSIARHCGLNVQIEAVQRAAHHADDRARGRIFRLSRKDEAGPA